MLAPVESRRAFLRSAGLGFGSLALAAQLRADDAKAKLDHAAKAKAVIFLFMEGGPSHVDLFDPKPELTKHHGEKLPASFGRVITPMGTGGNTLLASKRKFRKPGKSDVEISDWLPHMSEVADELCVMRACWADGLNHVGSVCQMNTGSVLAGRASLGSWALYGLGSENKNLPGFVVLTDNGEVTGGARNWGTGFMPATHQGTLFRSGPSPILNLAKPTGVTAEQQRDKLDLITKLNGIHGRNFAGESDLNARQSAYELAFRMQATAPDVIDLSKEDEKTKEAYGLNKKETAEFGHRCLLARRLVERGVRFVQIYCGAGSQWDAHGDIEGNHTKMCLRADQPSAALIRDLKQRGLLDSTLVIWGGEFGRTPMSEGSTGRDHNPFGFTTVLAGGGSKPGTLYGKTDDFGLRGIEGKMHIHDLHATILHLMGLDHEELTYRYLGRDERLTITDGIVAQEVLR
jgi:hypothetical protein